MIDEEYLTNFMEFLRYLLYLKDEKAKVQRFVSGLPLTFKDQIEYDKPRSLEEVIGKLKHCYEQSKRKKKYQRTRPQDAGEKDNAVPYNKFNVVGKGHGSQPRGKNNKGEGKG